MRISIDEIKKLCMDVAIKHGLDEKDADIVVSEYLEGELRGRKCHGFSAFLEFGIKAIGSRRGEPKKVKDTETYTLIDGTGNLGQVVCSRAIPEMIEKARDKGISMLGIYNMESYLMPGTYARMAAENDIIAFAFNYGGKGRVSPAGSIDPVLATNPIAIGIPTKTKPIVLDMATSSYAMCKVRLALKLGEKLPEGMAIDNDGKPTTNPQDAMSGALFPFGGHKGSGLALVVEILSRCLLDVHEKDGQVYRGYFFIFMDPTKFIEMRRFKDNVEELVNKIKSSRKAPGVGEIFLPGEQSERNRQESLKKGYLEIEDKIIEEIRSL